MRAFPEFPVKIWTDKPGTFKLAHYTNFNHKPKPNPIFITNP